MSGQDGASAVAIINFVLMRNMWCVQFNLKLRVVSGYGRISKVPLMITGDFNVVVDVLAVVGSPSVMDVLPSLAIAWRSFIDIWMIVVIK